MIDTCMHAKTRVPKDSARVCGLDENMHAQVYPPGHPIDPSFRDGLRGPEYAKPVTIGSDVWVGGGAIILGGYRFRVYPILNLSKPGRM